jgi:hypothetical protein
MSDTVGSDSVVVVDDADKQELATRPKESGNQALMAFFGSEQIARCHNFAGTPQQIWRMMAMGRSSDVKKLRDHVNQVIEVVNIACEKVEIYGIDGEIVPAIRTVIHAKDGTMYASVADGVARSVAEMFAIFGNKPFVTPLPLKVEQITTRRGTTVLQLTPAM